MTQPGDASVLCVDVGGSSTKIGVFDRLQKVAALHSIPTQGPAPEFRDALCSVIRSAYESILAQGRLIAGIGIAIAGFLNDAQDRMIYNSNLPWLEGYPLRDRIQQEFSLPVLLEVDSNAAALAEFHLGAGRDSPRFLCITVGTGLGVGMVVEGRPLRFAYGCMGDAGHIIVQPNGPACPCGGHGCAEVFVSAPLLAEDYRVRSGRTEPCSLRTVIESARTSDAVALRILDEAGQWLGVACASLANTFFPDRIAFAGGFAEGGDLVLNGVRRGFETHASKFARDQATLTRASLGAMATLTGAAYPVLSAVRELRAVVAG
jgi:glucokinase